MGERYKMNSKETKGLLRGEYGQLPAPVNEEVRKKIIGDEPVITHRPADDIPPEMDKYRAECAEWIQQEEDVLSYALFPQVALNFFKARKEQQEGKSVAAAAPEAPKAEAPAPNYQLGKAIGVNMDVKVYPK